MTVRPQIESAQREALDHARLCLATAAVALLVALCGAIVNYFVPTGFAAGGLAIVGLFYLLLGLGSFAWHWRKPQPLAAEVHWHRPQVQRPRHDVVRATKPWERN